MVKFFNEHPYISAYLGLVGLGAVASSIQEVGTAMSGIFVQLNWCGEENYICKLVYWALIIGTFSVVALILDFIHHRKLSLSSVQDNVPAITDEKGTQENVRLGFVENFSTNLDQIKEKRSKSGWKITGIGLAFLEKIKNAPPFLGLEYTNPIISQPIELKLTEFFRASIYMEENGNDIRGGPIRMRTGDTRKIIAKRTYGHERYEVYVPDKLTYPNGTWMELPYINRNRPDHPNDVKKHKEISDDIDTIKSLLKTEYYLVENEAVPIFRMIYDAAQLTLDEMRDHKRK